MPLSIQPASLTGLPVSASVPYSSAHGHGHDGPGSGLRQWSSVIGIVTAIVGNVLISFALNIQRYAHIRIDREANSSARKASRVRGKQSPNRLRGYGTVQQEDIAEERARLNAIAQGPGHKASKNLPDDEDTIDETHPLNESYESDATLTGSEKNNDSEDERRKSYLKSPYWWIGIVLMTIGEAGNFLAYGFAPASIVSPLGVVALVVNCVIAPFMLKERFRKRDACGVLVAIGGVVTVVLSAKQNETKMGPNDLWDTIRRWEFLLYVGITVVAIIALMFASPKYGSRSILINLGLVGLFGGYTALSTKGVASLLSDSLFRAFTFPITYFLILILVSSAIMQIRYLNRALQDFDSTQVIPTQFVLFTLSVIIGSTVLYRDFEAATAERVGKFVGGCLLTFFGVYLITSAREKTHLEDDEDLSDEEEGIHLVDEEAGHVAERAPLNQQHFDSQLVDRPVTPDQETSRPRSSRASSSVPSIAVTQDANASANSLNPPWLSSTDVLDEVPSPARSQPDVFKTPQLARLRSDIEPTSTPYFTPSSAPRYSRTTSSPSDPQTPTKTGKRPPSPPKADPSARPPPSPHSITRSARGSIGRLLPGPLMPTLSSSLSAVVAESLLRGEGSPRQQRTSLRRNRSSRAAPSDSANGTPTDQIRRRQSVDLDGELSRTQTRRTEPDADVRDVVEAEESVGKKKSRLRAMSDNLGGLLGGSRRGKRRKDDGGPDTGAGGSGSGSGNGSGSRTPQPT